MSYTRTFRAKALMLTPMGAAGRDDDYENDASPQKSVCREKAANLPWEREQKPTRELTLHPEPPGGLMEETKSIKHCRKRAVRAAQGVLRP
jgi:hypothetical protein